MQASGSSECENSNDGHRCNYYGSNGIRSCLLGPSSNNATCGRRLRDHKVFLGSSYNFSLRYSLATLSVDVEPGREIRLTLDVFSR
jgi:hypothetical protein